MPHFVTNEERDLENKISALEEQLEVMAQAGLPRTNVRIDYLDALKNLAYYLRRRLTPSTNPENFRYFVDECNSMETYGERVAYWGRAIMRYTDSLDEESDAMYGTISSS
jgi:hypothetical protein